MPFNQGFGGVSARVPRLNPSPWPGKKKVRGTCSAGTLKIEWTLLRSAREDHVKKIYEPEKAYLNKEFLDSDEARTIRILSEILEPMHRLAKHRVHSTVLFLGSSRLDLSDKRSPLLKYYWDAEELAFRLASWAIKLHPKGKNFG